MGDSYDWFYRNLKNADGTISIRPFISLLKSAINKACKEIHKIESYKPVLFQKCYTDREVRSSAVSEHLEDMQKTWLEVNILHLYLILLIIQEN
jgi:hypothetical protein